MVETILSSEGGFIFTITKLVDNESIDNNNSYKVFRFKNFDNFISFCKYIKNMNYFNAKKLSKDFSLVLYENTYYLSILNIDNLSPHLLLALTEFSDTMSYSPYIDGFLNEYGKIIFNGDAICKCIKMIKE